MVGHHEQALLTQAQPLALLRRRYHFKGLARAHHMGQQGVPTIEDVGDGVYLVLPQGDLRVDAHKVQVAPIVFAGAGTVELHIVELAQLFPALGVFPYPVLERLLDKFLLALGDGGFFLVQDWRSFAVCINNIIKNADIPLVQCFLDNFVGIDPPGAVGVGRLNIGLVVGFALNVPRPGMLGVVDFDILLCIVGRIQQFKHELLDHFDGEPVRAQPHGNLAGGQVYRLHPFQGFYIGGVVLRVQLGAAPCPLQLFPHVAGEVFIGGQILFGGVAPIAVHGVDKDNAL